MGFATIARLQLGQCPAAPIGSPSNVPTGSNQQSVPQFLLCVSNCHARTRLDSADTQPAFSAAPAIAMNGSGTSQNGGGDEPVPYRFLCAISKKVMREPMKAACGHYFDKASIAEWSDGSAHVITTAP